MLGLKTKTAPVSTTWLACLNALYAQHDTLDGLLRRAVELAVELLRAEHGIITWIREDKSAMQVRAHFSAGRRNGVLLKFRPSIPLPADLKECPRLEFETGEMTGAVCGTPLCINRRVVGFLYLVRHAETELLAPLSAQIGFAIEAQQLRCLLASRYAAAASRGDPGRFVLRAVQNPEKVVKMIAKSFYKDLRKAGFATDQILMVASEIIGNLNETLQKTKARTEPEREASGRGFGFAPEFSK